MCHSSTCVCVCHKCMIHYGSAFEPGASRLPHYCTPPVCVPDVIGALPVWWQNTQHCDVESRSTSTAWRHRRRAWMQEGFWDLVTSIQDMMRLWTRWLRWVIPLTITWLSNTSEHCLFLHSRSPTDTTGIGVFTISPRWEVVCVREPQREWTDRH